MLDGDVNHACVFNVNLDSQNVSQYSYTWDGTTRLELKVAYSNTPIPNKDHSMTLQLVSGALLLDHDLYLLVDLLLI